MEMLHSSVPKNRWGYNMKLIVIDGNSLINRAYYAMQRPMITKSGLYTQGVYGFLNMLNKIITDYQPEYLAVAFDRKAPTFRHLAYAEYKAGRKKMPPELAMQMPLLKEVLAAMNIKTLEIDGFEADDIIGTVVKQGEIAGMEPLVITGDKDELQLASDKTKILITKKGISEFDLYDEAAMIEKYGFTPEQFIDFKGLMGDQSDNIPGIPGVGEKTALKLIQEYKSIANLIEHVDEITSKSLKSKIEEHAQLALMSRSLATIHTNVPIEINFEDFLYQTPDYDALINLYIKLEFNSFMKKLQMQKGKEGTLNQIEPFGASLTDLNTSNEDELETQKTEKSNTKDVIPQRDKLDSIHILDFEAIGLLEKDIQIDPKVVIKVIHDHNHKDIPLVYAMCILSTKAFYYVDMDHSNLMSSCIATLTASKAELRGHSLKDDFYALFANGFIFPNENNQESAVFHTAFDTAIAQYLLEPSRSDYSLKSLILEYFHEEMEAEESFLKTHGQLGFLAGNEDQFIEFGRNWCIFVEKLTAMLSNKLIEENLEQVFFDAELPLIEVLASMEHYGFAVNCQELIDAGKDLNLKIEEMTARIHQLAGEEFNINSPIQLGPILFEKLALPFGKKTKRGYATGVEILEKLKDDYEIADLILEYRMYTKLKSTYIEGLLPLIHKDKKIHAHFQQTVAATGRLSCIEPNLQNIPIRYELGRKLRKAFVPESKDYILVGADYSQIELRLLAHLSQDPELIEAFNHGDDIHKITASKVFNVPLDQVSPLQRSNAKAVNFGVIYGMSGFGLSTELNITRKEAESYIGEYFKKYSKVKEYLDHLVKSCKEDGYVTTLLNRKRVVPEINASNYMVRQAGERLAMNSPIQGTAADIIKLAMIKVYHEINKRKLKSKLILQVHDELIIQTHQDEVDLIKQLLKENMEQAFPLSVALLVEVSNGINWYELK